MSVQVKKPMRWRFHKSVLILVGLLVNFLLASGGSAEDILIRIVGNGGSAHYFGPGQTTPEPVKVKVGDKLIWQNEGNSNHTATSFDNTGALNFDTGSSAHHNATPPFNQSSPIEITTTMFDRAGGTPGNAATIDYFCDFHGSMEGMLEVRESDSTTPTIAKTSAAPVGAMAVGAAGANRIRRDITTLSTTDLNAYRDAWRRIQSSGAFQSVAGYHGCPRFLCHADESIFFPWHREYLIRLEAQLGGPVHYWDWSAPSASSVGIPVAFTTSTYLSADGRVYANPLRSAFFRCPSSAPSRSTFRSPRSPFLLASYAAGVRNAYLALSFSNFSDSINFGPHGSVHTWVNGDMRSTTNAAYDPIFWAHHSNVDRQWATWQANGKPNPPSTTLSRPLPGFAPKTAADVLSISSLGYAYDRLDTIPVSFAPSTMEAFTQRDGDMGVGKSFSVAAPSSSGAVAPMESMAPHSDAPVQLLVGGIAAHPKQSLFVYVFANQPNASIEDARPENPRFLGTFGVFGGSGDPAAHDGPKERAVMSLPSGFQERIGQAVTEVTLVVVDENDAIVSREQIPINSARLEMVETSDAGPVDAASESKPARWKSYEGRSSRESYDEAYQNAVNAAYADLARNKPDAMIETHVQSVDGTRGGIAAFRILKVKIQARLK
jgi:plastocyanin